MSCWIAEKYEQLIMSCSRRKATAVLLQSDLAQPERFVDWPTACGGNIGVPVLKVGHDIDQLKNGFAEAAKSRLVTLMIHKRWIIAGVPGDEEASMAVCLEEAKAAVERTGARLIAVVTGFALHQHGEWVSAMLRKHGVEEATMSQFYQELCAIGLPVRMRETAPRWTWTRMLAEVRVLCSLL